MGEKLEIIEVFRILGDHLKKKDGLYGFFVGFLVSLVICVTSTIYLFIKPQIFDRQIQLYVNETINALPTFTPLPTYTAYPTNTPYPTYTTYPTPTPYPTFTPLPPISMTSTPSSFIKSGNFCFDTEIWRVEEKNDVTIKIVNDKKCYDLTQWEIYDFINEKKTLMVEFNPSRQSPAIQGIRRLNQSLSWEETFKIKIENISSSKKCIKTNVCDVDFIMGVGDPNDLNGRGHFIIFRSVTKGADILVCSLPSRFETCSNPNDKISTNLLPVHFNITIKRSFNKVEIIVGNKIYSSTINNFNYPFLWIGYSFRSAGEIYVVVEFITPDP